MEDNEAMLRTTASNRRIVIWNAAGSAVYALSSFLLLIIVIRVCGEVEGGIFSIGYAIAQLMLTVGVFESTTYFATDAGNRFSYAQYLAFKIATCALMVAASAVYVLSFGFDAHKAAVAYALVAYRLFEALAQYWFAAFQKEERLDLGGFSTVWRSVLSIAAFAAVLVLSHDVVGAMVAASLVEAVWIAAYDVPRLRRIVQVGRPDFSPKPLARLFLACLPLFVKRVLAAYLGNVCKYAIEAAGTEQMQTVFNVLFMPSFVINLFMIFLMRPTLTRLAKLWLGHEARPFLRIIGRLLLAVAGITVGGRRRVRGRRHPRAGSSYGIDLDAYLMPLLVVLLGGGFLSASNVFYNAMVVIRTQNAVVVGYVGAIVVATLVSVPLVEAAGVTGASVAYALSCLVLAVLFAGLFAFGATRRIRDWGAGRAQAAGHGRNARRRRRAHRRKTFRERSCARRARRGRAGRSLTGTAGATLLCARMTALLQRTQVTSWAFVEGRRHHECKCWQFASYQGHVPPGASAHDSVRYDNGRRHQRGGFRVEKDLLQVFRKQRSRGACPLSRRLHPTGARHTLVPGSRQVPYGRAAHAREELRDSLQQPRHLPQSHRALWMGEIRRAAHRVFAEHEQGHLCPARRDGTPLEYAAYFVAAAGAMVDLRWIRDGFKESPQEMAALYARWILCRFDRLGRTGSEKPFVTDRGAPRGAPLPSLPPVPRNVYPRPASRRTPASASMPRAR